MEQSIAKRSQTQPTLGRGKEGGLGLHSKFLGLVYLWLQLFCAILLEIPEIKSFLSTFSMIFGQIFAEF
jgi:hypothetical protein